VRYVSRRIEPTLLAAELLVRPEMADGLLRLGGASRGRETERAVVFRGGRAGSETTVLRPGVRALSLNDTLALLSSAGRGYDPPARTEGDLR
jgi:hypothetical protein